MDTPLCVWGGNRVDSWILLLRSLGVSSEAGARHASVTPQVLVPDVKCHLDILF